jgi:pyridoxal phosphate enzyme (YggS family)
VTIAGNVAAVEQQIAAACCRAGRARTEVKLVAVTKTRSAAEVSEVIGCGITAVGENRVQEALAKKRLVTRPAEWHLVGNLQTNKAKKALDIFDVVQTVDSARLAQELETRCATASRSLPVLVEVNTSAEASKHGLAPESTPAFIESLLALKHLRLTGLMTIGPGLAVEDAEASRPCFRLLRELAEDCRRRFGIALPELSMGMSSDFPVGIEEGATIIRIGTALFGPRPQ